MHRFSPMQHEESDRQVEQMLSRGLVEESDSEWATSMVLVVKKDGQWRAAIDYRGLNAVTRPDEYPLPRTDDLIDEMEKARYFTVIDMMWGFWQLPLRQEDRKKTAFRTRRGLFHWKVMPFGVRNGTASFQRMMRKVLQGIEGVLVYIDDVIVFTRTQEEHLEVVDRVLQRLEQFGLVGRLSKCEFMREQVEFVGYVVGYGRVEMQARLCDKVAACREPANKSEVRAFVGMCSFYRHFMEAFATVAAPHTDVMGKVAKWQWGEKQVAAFRELQRLITSKPVLKLPDFSSPFSLFVDASDVGIGAVLGQLDD